jgi:hypothetical protein
MIHTEVQMGAGARVEEFPDQSQNEARISLKSSPEVGRKSASLDHGLKPFLAILRDALRALLGERGNNALPNSARGGKR